MRPEEVVIGREYKCIANNPNTEELSCPLNGEIVVANALVSNEPNWCHICKGNTMVDVTILWNGNRDYLACACTLHPIDNPDAETETEEELELVKYPPNHERKV